MFKAWFVSRFFELKGKITFRGGGALGGHLTLRILSLLRYVLDIVKSSPNPRFF